MDSRLETKFESFVKGNAVDYIGQVGFDTYIKHDDLFAEFVEYVASSRAGSLVLTLTPYQTVKEPSGEVYQSELAESGLDLKVQRVIVDIHAEVPTTSIQKYFCKEGIASREREGYLMLDVHSNAIDLPRNYIPRKSKLALDNGRVKVNPHNFPEPQVEYDTPVTIVKQHHDLVSDLFGEDTKLVGYDIRVIFSEMDKNSIRRLRRWNNKRYKTSKPFFSDA